jgi:hypothetical protein
MAMRKLRHLPARYWQPFVVVVVSRLVGAAFVVHSRATPFTVTTEAENGTQSGNAALVNDTGASGGKAVAFQAATTTPPGTMDPPAGATLVRDLTQANSWSKEGDGHLDQQSENGPGGQPVLRSTLVDGQTGAPSGIPSERNDLQGGTVPLESTRWMVWYERFIQLPTTNIDDWQILGPNEIHGETLSQATMMPEISATKTRRLNANAGRPAAHYYNVGNIVMGQWYQMKFGIHYTQNSNGWFELWRDGVRVVRVDGATTTENQAGYWKFGNYRNAAINGDTVYDISGCKIYGQ